MNYVLPLQHESCDYRSWGGRMFLRRQSQADAARGRRHGIRAFESPAGKGCHHGRRPLQHREHLARRHSSPAGLASRMGADGAALSPVRARGHDALVGGCRRAACGSGRRMRLPSQSGCNAGGTHAGGPDAGERCAAGYGLSHRGAARRLRLNDRGEARWSAGHRVVVSVAPAG